MKRMFALFQNRECFALAAALFGLAFAVGVASAVRGFGKCAETRMWKCAAEFVLGASAWAVLSWALFERGSADGKLPVSNVFEIFQSLAWLSVFFVAFLRFVWSLRVPAFFGYGVAAILGALGFANVQQWDSYRASADALAGMPWVSVHVVLAMLGYAFFSATAMIWGVYLLQNFALRKRRTHPFFERLPDLASLDRIAGRLCAAGLIVFGIGVALGGILFFCENAMESVTATYKLAVSLAVFLGFLALLSGRRRGRLSAPKFARFGLVLFLIAIVLLGGIACMKEVSKAEEIETERAIAE